MSRNLFKPRRRYVFPAELADIKYPLLGYAMRCSSITPVLDLHDLLQEACIAALSVERELRLVAAWRAVVDALRKILRRGSSTRQGGEVCIDDATWLAAPEQPQSDPLALEQLARAMTELGSADPQKHRLLIDTVWGDATHAEAAASIGVQPQSVCVLRDRAIKQLRKHFGR